MSTHRARLRGLGAEAGSTILFDSNVRAPDAYGDAGVTLKMHIKPTAAQLQLVESAIDRHLLSVRIEGTSSRALQLVLLGELDHPHDVRLLFRNDEGKELLGSYHLTPARP